MLKRLGLAFAVLIAVTASAQSQQPPERHAPKPPQTEAQRAGQPADERGTEQSPVIVKVLPVPKTQEEISRDARERQDKAFDDNLTLWFTGLSTAIFALQLIVFGLQARRLRQTIKKMDEIAAGQTADMQASIAQATRAAVAMEAVALSMATQVITTTTMAQNQREFWQRQMRAYLFLNTATIINVADPPATFRQVPGQEPPGGRLQYKDRGPLAHISIRNSGHTPAHSVVHSTHMVVREFPLQHPLPDIPRGAEQFRSVSDIPPGGGSTAIARLLPPLTADEIAGLRAATHAIYVYGDITYNDAFGQAHTTRYRYRHNEQTGAIGMSTELTVTSDGNSSD